MCWDELDLGAVHPKTSDPTVSHVHTDKIEGFGRMWLGSQGITTQYVFPPRDILTECELILVQMGMYADEKFHTPGIHQILIVLMLKSANDFPFRLEIWILYSVLPALRSLTSSDRQ